MDSAKKKRLEDAGWKVASAKDFLGLTDEEEIFVELKVALSEQLKKERTARKLSQVDLARRLRSSQSRVPKMEAADPSVSVDLIIRGLLAAGASRTAIAAAIGSRPRRKRNAGSARQRPITSA